MAPLAKTAARGYGGPHQKHRARWRPIVDAGQGWCHAITCLKPTRWIQPGTPWHLGHNPARTAWTGPEHEQCNLAEVNRRRAKRNRIGMVTSRRW